MRRLKHLISGIVLPGASGLLCGCKMDVLQPAGPIGVKETYLLVETTLAMLIVVVPVIVMTFWFAWRYRASASESVYAPKWSYSRNLEFIVWGIPFAIVTFLGVVVWRSTHELDPFKPFPRSPRTINVEVVALDWKWLFIYPDQHIASINQLEIPTGTQIAFKITSSTVMNVFFIPKLGTQIYAMAGMQTQLHLEAKNEGVFRGLSANFSGPGFADMRFSATAVDRKTFDAWVAHTQAVPAILDGAAYKKLTAQSSHNPVQYFGQVDPNLFGHILAEFHGPSMPFSDKTE